MQPEARRQLTTRSEGDRLIPTDQFPQNLFDRIAAERQLHQLRQHLEAGQGFLQGSFRWNQNQPVNQISIGAEAADRSDARWNTGHGVALRRPQGR